MLMEAYHIRLLRKIWYQQIEGSMLRECAKIKSPPLHQTQMIVVAGAAITADKTQCILISRISQGVRQHTPQRL